MLEVHEKEPAISFLILNKFTFIFKVVFFFLQKVLILFKREAHRTIPGLVASLSVESRRQPGSGALAPEDD